MANTRRGGLHRLRVVMLLTAVLFFGIPGTPVAAQPTSADPGVLVVDTGSVECPEAGYNSIQAAVDAAAPNSLIRVCPGLYTESVTVSKPLTLKAFPSRSHAESCSQDSSSDANDPSDVIVDSPGGDILDSHPTSSLGNGVAFYLMARRIVLDGFVIQNNAVGVKSEPASASVIKHNLFQNNSAGVSPDTNPEASSEVSYNCFRDHTGPISTGIVSLAPVSNLRIHHNAFVRNTFGIRFGPSIDVTISHNTSLFDGTWLRMGGTQNLTVQYNRIGSGGHEGMLFLSGLTGLPNQNARITDNAITGRGSHGFRAQESSLVNSVLSNNHIFANEGDGIRIEVGGNFGNRITDNKLNANTEHDCHDETAGLGTAGTANFWFGNKALTENRVGLCVEGA